MGAGEDQDLETSLSAIAARWRAIERLRAWANLPPSRREAVYAELEETARAVGDDAGRDLLAAADALESLVPVLDVFGVHFAARDVETLLALAEKRSR